MKKLLLQLIGIFGLSLALGLSFNYFQETPLPLFNHYTPPAAQYPEEDLSVYYREMDAETLKSLLEADMVVLLDARRTQFYHEAHIPTAISLPIGDFAERYEIIRQQLDKSKSIVVYCIGIHCIDSALLARELTKKGYKEIYVFKGGIDQWKELGYETEASELYSVPPDNNGGNSSDGDRIYSNQ
jgi:rhodanese-related sulfurtransferase